MVPYSTNINAALLTLLTYFTYVIVILLYVNVKYISECYFTLANYQLRDYITLNYTLPSLVIFTTTNTLLRQVSVNRFKRKFRNNVHQTVQRMPVRQSSTKSVLQIYAKTTQILRYLLI